MTGKRPAKPIAGQIKQTVKDPAVYGATVMYFGSKSSTNKCPTCGQNTVRGILRQKEQLFFCSGTCAKSF